MQKQDEKIKATLDRLLEMFRTGNLPSAVALTVIRARAGHKRPSDSWSLGNVRVVPTQRKQ
jgi:hypothetical protein